MADSGDHNPDVLSHGDVPEPRTRLDANATGTARIYQAARDLHFHYRDGVRDARRAESADVVDECPYPGLFAFDRQHARWFHGRDRLIAQLVARLDGRLRRGGPLVVVGASGAGKSSLLQAGLVPALAKGALPGSRHWPCVLCTPTPDPIAALTTALREHVGVGSDVTAQAIRDVIGEDGARVVVVVDQLEELFTQCPNAWQRLDFLNLLDDLATADPDGRPPVALVVYGLRADFYARCADHPPLRDAVQDDHVLVGPLSSAELREAILYPVEDVGLDIEPGLVELLLADIGVTGVSDAEGGYPAGRLPLLAHALRGTWQRRDGNTLTVAAYRATGGIHEAIATTADAVFSRLSPARQDAARAMFLRLVRIGENTQDTRRRVPKADLLARHDDIASSVVDPFTDSRLLTADRDTVEITHEALLDAWPRLREWINTDRAGNLLRQQVDEGATAWERNQRDTALLYRGSRLGAAREWADSPHDDDLSPAARAFLDASTHYENRAKHRRRTAIAVLSVLVLLAASATVVAFVNDRLRADATFYQVAAEADRLRSTDVSVAAQLDLVAHRLRPDDESVDTALVNMENTPLYEPESNQSPPGDDASSSPVAPIEATIVDNGHAIQLWNVSDPGSPQPEGPPLDGGNDLDRIVWSSDGTAVAAFSERTSQPAHIWNVAKPSLPQSLGPIPAAFGELALGPGGHTFATSNPGGGNSQLWRLSESGKTVAVPLTVPYVDPTSGNATEVGPLAFSPDGDTLATYLNTNTVNAATSDFIQLWDVTNPAQPVMAGPSLAGKSATFSPDGSMLATVGDDGTVQLWNVNDPGVPTTVGQPLSDPDSGITSAAFLRAGTALVTTDDVGRTLSWSLPPTVLARSDGRVDTVVFSPGGHILAIDAGYEEPTILWNLADAMHAIRTLTDQPVNGDVTFSVARPILASGNDNSGDVWDLSIPTKPVLAGNVPGTPLAFDPVKPVLAIDDGNGTGVDDGTISLWNVANPRSPRLMGHIPGDSPVFATKGAIVAVNDGQNVNDQRDMVSLWRIDTPPQRVAAISGTSPIFSTDGNTLAVTDGTNTQLWNVERPSAPIRIGTVAGTPELFSPTSPILVTDTDPNGGDSANQFWNISSPAHPTPIGSTIPAEDIVLSPDGKVVATTHPDGTISLWQIRANTITAMGSLIASNTTAIAFSPDGEFLAAGGDDGTVRVWNLNVDSAMRRICATTPRLSAAQWQQYIPEQLGSFDPCR